MSGALVAQAINESIGTAGFQGLDAILKEYLGLIAEQAGTARVPISRTINGHSLANDVDLDNDDVDAAPAGFGLGTFAAIMPNSDFNKIWRCGMYRFGSDGENRPPFSDWGYLTVMSTSDYNSESIQIAFQQTSANVCVMRTKSHGVWSEWEWVNPPLIAGVEYRTTERHGGKAVYTKLLDCGTVTNGKAVSHGAGSGLIRMAPVCSGILSTSINDQADSWAWVVNADQTAVRMTCGSGIAGNASWEVQIWYTKD